MTGLVLVLVVAAVLAWPRAVEAEPDASPPPGRPWRVRRPWARGGDVAGDWVADLAEVVSVGLRAGLDLPSAASVGFLSPGVVRAAPWLGPRLEGCAARGLGPAAALVDPPVPPCDAADLALLARAWRLSEVTGAAASRTTEAAAAALRARTAARERAAAALAGPRASMRVLTALPLAGPLAGVALGLPPTTLYGSAPARASAAVGVLLALVGWAWSRRLVSLAGRAARTSEGT